MIPSSTISSFVLEVSHFYKWSVCIARWKGLKENGCSSLCICRVGKWTAWALIKAPDGSSNELRSLQTRNDTGTEWKLIASLRCEYSEVGALETQQLVEWVRTGGLRWISVWTNKCVIFINIYIFHYGSPQKALLSVLGVNSGIRESSAGWEGWEITAASLNTHPDPHSTSRNVQLKHAAQFP